MGNNRFKLAEMIPNTWFYKLKDSSRSVNTSNSRKTPNEVLHHNPKVHVPPPQPLKPRRPSYYIPSNEEYKFPNSPINLKASDTKCLIDSPREPKESPNTMEKVPKDAGLFIEIDLPPILTKPAKEKVTYSYRKKKSNGGSRQWGAFSSSFAVVKCSSDPKKEFRESMVEMIVENEIYKAKDLEELLACYLKLNSDEYHDLILMVFEQLWIDLCYIKRKHANT